MDGRDLDRNFEGFISMEALSKDIEVLHNRNIALEWEVAVFLFGLLCDLLCFVKRSGFYVF